MIVPIHGLKYHQFKKITIDEPITLIKEKDNLFDEFAIAAYSKRKEKIGYVSKKSCRNVKVFCKMQEDEIICQVWSVGRNQILVELDSEQYSPKQISKKN